MKIKSWLHRRVISVMVATWPTVTMLTWGFASLTAQWPMPLRTLLNTVASVPIILYLIVPRISPIIDRLIGPVDTFRSSDD